MHTKDMPSVLDREIQSTEEDAFGHRHFAKALGSLIESPTNIPPFSIGLLGKWGTGKSTISAIYLKSLKDDVKLSKKIQTIAFNAWRFGGGDIKRALLRHVYLAIGGDKSKLKDWLSRTVLSSVREPRRWLDIKYDFYEKTFWGIVPTTFIYVILFSVLFGVKNYLNISNELILGNLVAIVFIIAAFISKKLIELKLQIPRYADVFRFDHPNVSSEEYENYLVEQLRKYKKNDKKGKSCERLVIFIDDLDRLSSDEMVSGLEAIRAFMELPIEELPKNLGIIFVVSCDEERISNALSRNKRLSNSDLPGTIFSHYDAHRYLDRIFQFRLEIPPFPKRDMRNYALKKNSIRYA